MNFARAIFQSCQLIQTKPIKTKEIAMSDNSGYLVLDLSDIEQLSEERKAQLLSITDELKTIGDKTNSHPIETLVLTSRCPEFNIALSSLISREDKACSAYRTSMSDYWSVAFTEELNIYLKENGIRMPQENNLGLRTISLADIFLELSSAYTSKKQPCFFEDQINTHNHVFSFNTLARVKLTISGQDFLSAEKLDTPKVDDQGYSSWRILDLIRTFSPMFIKSVHSKPFHQDIFVD